MGLPGTGRMRRVMRAGPGKRPARRIVFAVSGASGAPLASAVFSELLGHGGIELHLVVSRGARLVMRSESRHDACAAFAAAHAAYEPEDLAAPPASGSWRHDGMVVCPCSMSSLAAIASGCGTNLVHRAADVALKERLPLVLVPRETPLSLIHLRNMAAAAEAGATIMPFCPAFYAAGPDLPAQMRQFAGRLLDQLGIKNNLCGRWGG